jgi:hypothetical protein
MADTSREAIEKLAQAIDLHSCEFRISDASFRINAVLVDGAIEMMRELSTKLSAAEAEVERLKGNAPVKASWPRQSLQCARITAD